ncbi:MAG: L-threonylcarbamoyladenylate synthase [Verrucomicrobiota bacterium]
MQTQIISTGFEDDAKDAVRQAADLLRAGEIVALPTETVYGLAADAFNAAAVAKVFEAKERPSFDPLIVHLPKPSALEEVADLPEEIAGPVKKILNKFWPGPLTIILPKKDTIPDIVTSGQPTVAVRHSKDPVFKRVIKEVGGPLAAPSANRFGSISPTSAAAVEEELGGRIPLIVDGGACSEGLESTIIRVEAAEPKSRIFILRAGPITKEDLREFGKVEFAPRLSPDDGQPEAPGQLASHYSPRTPLRLLESPNDFKPEDGKRYALLSYRNQPKDGYLELTEYEKIAVLSPGSGKLPEAAVRFFFLLRELDESGVDEIIAEPIPNRGLGVAIRDRLSRAAYSTVE